MCVCMYVYLWIDWLYSPYDNNKNNLIYIYIRHTYYIHKDNNKKATFWSLIKLAACCCLCICKGQSDRNDLLVKLRCANYLWDKYEALRTTAGSSSAHVYLVTESIVILRKLRPLYAKVHAIFVYLIYWLEMSDWLVLLRL